MNYLDFNIIVMKTYIFKMMLRGTGEDVYEAWDDALEGLNSCPEMPDDNMIELEEIYEE